MTTVIQDRDFIDSVIDNNLLEKSIDWIRENFDPEDVFSTSELDDWAESQGYKPLGY